MNNKGLTLSVIFEAESANYGEGFGNIQVLKKMSRGDGNSYSYISRQALRYNIVNQLNWDNTPVSAQGSGDAKVVQYEPMATIAEFPEIDLFGYMKTFKKGEGKSGCAKTRSAVARLSNAISLEPYNADMDFLTNMGLAKRNGIDNNISQSEIHKSYYSYSLTVDLDLVGEDKTDNVSLSNEEKAKRVKDLLMAIKTLYRDIKGRRENLSPIFVIGGVYDVKSPFFENRLKISKNKLNIDCVSGAVDIAGDATRVGYLSGTLSNESEIASLNPLKIGEFFAEISKEVEEFYGQGN